MPHSIQFAGFASGDGDPPADAASSSLVAWDPVRARPAWRSRRRRVRTTAARSRPRATSCSRDRPMATSMPTRQATAGALWTFDAGTAVLGTPITFSVNGRQYVAMLSGPLHGSVGGFGSMAAQFGWNAREHPRRLLAFALDAKGEPAADAAAAARRAARRTGFPGRRGGGPARASSSTRAACCATVRARSQAAPRPICAHRRSRSTALHSRQWSATAASSRGACRSLPSSPTASSTRYATTSATARDSRPEAASEPLRDVGVMRRRLPRIA